MSSGTDTPSTNGSPIGPAGILRRLDTPGAAVLADLNATFEELQTVLRCCEWLVATLAGQRGAVPEGTAGPEGAAVPEGAAGPGGGAGPEGVSADAVVIEAVWTLALLSYARCFSADGPGAALSADDLTATKLGEDVLDWHTVLLQLRDHYADPAANPRERFSVVVTQDASGAASGIGVTSARQPLVDDLTVRQTGAITFSLSRLVNDRIAAQQQTVFGEVKDIPKADLDKLDRLDVESDPGA